jgi:hypothetical protein
VLERVAVLEGFRDRVAAAQGDPATLAVSLADLDTAFTEATGKPPVRHAGSMYAARGLVFEDCRRSIDVVLGAPILRAAGPALGLVFTSARWLTFEAARAYRAVFRKLHRDLAERSGSPVVPFPEMWFRAQRSLFGAKDRPLDEAVADLQRRWARILRFSVNDRQVQYSSDELSAQVAAEFAAEGPGWLTAMHHCPDLMVAAESVEAIERDQYSVVLGELHVGSNTLERSCMVGQHPDAEELRRALEADFPLGRVLLVPSKDWPMVTVRTSRALVTRNDRFVETGFDRAAAPPDRVLSMGDFDVVLEGDEVVVRSRDGRSRIDIIEFVSDALGQSVQSVFRLLPRSTHTPRITIDRLIVARETWVLRASELEFASLEREIERFDGTRAWAERHGVPRFFFAKAGIEVKPVFVDLDSPVFVDLFAKIVRRAARHVSGESTLVITEMVPRLDQLWLSDAAGHRYTSEMRTVAVDPLGPSRGGRPGDGP